MIVGRPNIDLNLPWLLTFNKEDLEASISHRDAERHGGTAPFFVSVYLPVLDHDRLNRILGVSANGLQPQKRFAPTVGTKHDQWDSRKQVWRLRTSQLAYSSCD